MSFANLPTSTSRTGWRHDRDIASKQARNEKKRRVAHIFAKITNQSIGGDVESSKQVS
jgi:hypothetical protein